MNLLFIIAIVIIIGYQIRTIRLLRQIKRLLLKQNQKKYHIVFYQLTNNSITKNGVITMLPLTKTQKCTIKVKALDSQVPPVEAPMENIQFISTDESVCSVIQEDPTDLSKAVVYAHNDGVAQINVSADADLGEGEMPLEGVLSVEVQTVFGTNLGIEVGTPEEQ